MVFDYMLLHTKAFQNLPTVPRSNFDCFAIIIKYSDSTVRRVYFNGYDYSIMMSTTNEDVALFPSSPSQTCCLRVKVSFCSLRKNSSQ